MTATHPHRGHQRGVAALLAALLTALLTLAAPLAQAATEHRYTMIFSGHVAGEHVTRIADDGGIATTFSYRENGRGPDYAEQLRVGADGLLQRFAITGKSTFGSLVDERFERRGDTAEWSGVVDRGSLAVQGPALYVPIESTIEVAGLALRALTKAPGAALPGVPGGRLSATKLDELELARAAPSTERRRLALYAVRGASLEPSYLWQDVGSERAFALIYPGFAQLIEKGWEPQADELEARQLKAQETWLRDIAARNRHVLPQPVLIRNARVFDAEKAVLGAPQDVFVNDGRIAGVFPAGSVAPQGAGTVFDAAGRTLLPGLYDMHVHLSPGDYLLHLAAGVTTVRDLGNDNAVLARQIARLQAHEAIGPHVVPAGFLEGRSPFNASGGVVADSLADAKRAVDFYAQRGYPQIKIYNSFKPEWLAETVAYAHSRGLRVSGHVPAFMKAEDVVRAGYDEIQHINQLLLNFFVKPDTDTRTLARFTLVAENAHALDLDGKPFKDFVQLLVDRGVAVDPTIGVFEAQFTQKPGELNPSFAAIEKNLPITLRRGLYKSESELTDAIAPRWRASYARMVDAVGRLHRAGVPLVAGTDSFPGFALQRELELYGKAGISNAEVLKIATWNAASVSRTLADRGTVTVGKRADLALVDGDPTQDLGALRRMALVLQDGDAYYPADLYAELGVAPFAPALKPVAATP